MSMARFYEFSGERLLYSKIRPYLNKLTVVDCRGYCSSDMYPLIPDRSRVMVTYLATYMLSASFNEQHSAAIMSAQDIS